METATAPQPEATVSQSTQNSSQAGNSWFSTLLNQRYAETLRSRNLPNSTIDIPYLNSPEGIALLEAELRLHLHDQRIWVASPMLFYRHLMRAGATAADAGAIVGRSAHTIHTGAAQYKLSIKNAARHFADGQVNNGFMQVSPADLALVLQHIDHIDTQQINAHNTSLQLHSSLYF
jgi:hypothetical protein